MNKINYFKKIVALKENDLETMKNLCEQDQTNYSLKFEYAKLLIHNKLINEAKEVLIEQLDTKNKIYAMFELGKIESLNENYDEAKKYFDAILKIKKDYYTKLELGRLEVKFKHYEKAKKIFEEILQEKNDPMAVFELGKIELKLKNYSKARLLFKKVSKTILEPKLHSHGLLYLGLLETNVGNNDLAKEYLKKIDDKNFEDIVNRLLSTIEYKDNNYIEAFNIIRDSISKNYLIDDRLLFSICKKLNIFFKMDYSKLNYKYSTYQVINYDYNEALEHIYSHHASTKYDFNKLIDIELLFNEIKNHLTEEYRIKLLTFNDVYMFPFENIGSNGENYLKVVTLPNTKDIITMYPTKSDEVLEEVEYTKILEKNKLI